MERSRPANSAVSVGTGRCTLCSWHRQNASSGREWVEQAAATARSTAVIIRNAAALKTLIWREKSWPGARCGEGPGCLVSTSNSGTRPTVDTREEQMCLPGMIDWAGDCDAREVHSIGFADAALRRIVDPCMLGNDRLHPQRSGYIPCPIAFEALCGGQWALSTQLGLRAGRDGTDHDGDT